MRLLLVEDDTPLADATARGLRREGFAVDVAGDGSTAIDKLTYIDYDLVVLDRTLPDVSGDTICEQLVGTGARARVLMLSAAAELHHRVEGLGIGADDYLTKPFAMVELVARLRALARRAATVAPCVLESGDLRLDPARRTVERGCRAVTLTNREFGVLETLLLADGAVVSAEDLMERVWDDSLDPFSNAVRVTMSTLRRKLGEPVAIATIPGVGYQLA